MVNVHVGLEVFLPIGRNCHRSGFFTSELTYIDFKCTFQTVELPCASAEAAGAGTGERRTEVYRSLQLFIAGEWLDGQNRDAAAVLNPATGETIAVLPHATCEDLDRALDAAARAFAPWRRRPAHERGAIIRRGADLLRERAGSVAKMLTLEQGKPLAEAHAEIAIAADTLDWYAGEAQRAYGRVIPARSPGARQMALREPIGPIAAFSPWNFPAVTSARKIAPALAAGCPVVLKPAEETPATPLALARCLADAGLPAGVLNVVFGEPAAVSAHLIASPVIRKISFTGSVPVGKHLARLAADGLKRTTMELGGHAPVLVFADADPEQVATLAVTAKFRNAGQICTSPTRFYIEASVYERFVDAFAARAETIKLGPGLESSSTMGPLANARRLDAMMDLVADACRRGARLRSGGKRLGDQGFFFAPTVLADVPCAARVMSEEPFGPVATVVALDGLDAMLMEANRLPYGLAAYAFTRSTETARAVIDGLEAGLVGVNTFTVSAPETPFGGVKDSGWGYEGGSEGLDSYLATKSVNQA